MDNYIEWMKQECQGKSGHPEGKRGSGKREDGWMEWRASWGHWEEEEGGDSLQNGKKIVEEAKVHPLL